MTESSSEPIAAKIRRLRTDMGLTQREFAQLLGVVPETVGRWERGVTEPGHDDMRALEAHGLLVDAPVEGLLAALHQLDEQRAEMRVMLDEMRTLQQSLRDLVTEVPGARPPGETPSSAGRRRR